MKTKAPIAIYLPESLDFDRLAQLLPNSLAPYAQHAGWMISQIQQVRIFNKMAAEDFVSLKAAYLRRFFPQKTILPRVRKALLHLGIIETDNRFVFGKKSLGYRLGQEYLGQNHHKVELTDRSLVKKVEAYRKNDDKSSKLPVHKWLRGWLDELSIDIEAAKKDIEAEVAESKEWRDACHQSASMILNKDVFYKVDEYGRVHNNLTNLWSGLRKHLLVRGERLVNLDIRNSQPLLFGVILKNYFRNRDGLISFHEFSKECLKAVKEGKERNTKKNKKEERDNNYLLSPLPLPCPKDMDSLVDYEFIAQLEREELPLDVGQFISLCEQGRFYEFIMHRLKVDPDRRKEFKTTFFGSVFYNNTNQFVGPNAKQFSIWFPSVWNVLVFVKKRDFRHAARLMQKVESAVIIGRIAKRVMVEMRESWIGTIHDSVCCQEKDAEAIRKIMMEEFADIDLKPTINIERY